MEKKITSKTLSAFREGDHGAFEAILVVYFNKLKAFVYSYVKSEAAAQELTDNIFVSLWENRETIEQSISIDLHLYSLARNTSVNFLRNKIASGDHIGRYVCCQEDSSCQENAISKETALLIDLFVDQMPAQQKKIYNLSRKQGLSNEQIARQLKTTEGNVQAQLAQTVKSLREALV